MHALQSYDRAGFLAAECTQRQAAGMPPFAQLASVVLAAKEEALVLRIAKAYAASGAALAHTHRVQLLGPAPATMYRIRGWYRVRFLLQAPPDSLALQPMLRAWILDNPPPRTVRVHIDVNPFTFD
jgi:primosomal protein N' (replication factor Y)